MRMGNWEIVNHLGQGRWSKVALAKPHGCESNQADYIIKYIDEDSADVDFSRNMLIRELACSRLINHPAIIAFLDGEPQHATPFLVSARHPGESLQSLQREWSGLIELRDKLTCFRQVCEGIAELHRLGIRHGDLSPSNILFDPEQRQTLLVDLGLSEKVDPFRRDVDCVAGTWGYVAPECIRGDLPINVSADVYSLGVTMQEFMSSRPPIAAKVATAYSPVRAALDRLLIAMQARQPLKRPTIREVAERVSLLEISCLEVDYRAAS